MIALILRYHAIIVYEKYNLNKKINYEDKNITIDG